MRHYTFDIELSDLAYNHLVDDADLNDPGLISILFEAIASKLPKDRRYSFEVKEIREARRISAVRRRVRGR